ncbi:hypothetical protein [Amycolatopsis sp. NBC_01480]|uniref:hypothetical protein n=1 Tax=Amycolatopsis sp. NBC_01480 TaxID=2903562 RepID=UPI002E27F5AA|nr:hypothetical protein [Amycolatopsis sp. NBC_01480]
MTTKTTGYGDFDFLIGTWEVTNRRLLAPLTGGTEWDTFPGVSVSTGRIFDGGAHFDEIVFPTKGFRGLTLRLYDPERDEWSLNWASSRDGRLTPPVVGRFGPDGTGAFEGDDFHDGAEVRCRFRWSNISATTARWEQAFSADGGQAWETNWTMDFQRLAG